PGDVRSIADLLPAHRGDGHDVRAVDQDVLIAKPLEEGNKLHAKSHFGRPKAVEVVAPEQMPGEPEPAGQLLIPIGGRNQRQDGVIISSAEDLDDFLVLQLPEQIAAFDYAIGALLKIGP